MRKLSLLLALAAIALALALTLASFQWGVPFGSSRGSLSHYSNGDISFSYPAGWHTAAASGSPSTMPAGDAFVLSSQSLLDRYALLAHPLSPGGVLVTWTTGFGGPARISQVTGSPTQIGGQPATLTATKGDCSGLDAENADESMTASVGGYRMDACMRGPGLGRVKAEVQAMLRSVSFQTPKR